MSRVGTSVPEAQILQPGQYRLSSADANDSGDLQGAASHSWMGSISRVGARQYRGPRWGCKTTLVCEIPTFLDSGHCQMGIEVVRGQAPARLFCWMRQLC
jgi:hypothetical protein